MFRFYFIPVFCCFTFILNAQSPKDLAIPLHVSTGINPPAVLLTWPNPAISDIRLRRRVKGQPGNAWTDLVNFQGTLLDGYFDAGLSGDETYEYSLERKTANGTAYGFAFASFFKPAVDYRGKILIFIDSTTADILGADLITFKNDLRGEGWQTVPVKIGPTATVQSVKTRIQNLYNSDPDNTKAVLLIGNIPVPYSGSTAWDNRADHVGAWPCDAYYGDVNNGWTDQAVNLPSTSRAANRNVPGDGKFDQNILPSNIELAVGRLDFSRLSPGTFGASSIELIRKYLQKSHRYKTGQFKAPRQALVDDHLGWSNGAAYAADGYRNAYPLTDATGVTEGDFLAQTSPQRFLLGYGAGVSSSYSNAGGIGSAVNFANDSVQVVFASLFGDYFGDWDYEQNPLMPALLASNGATLACEWAGTPNWLQHGLATGESIGYCLRETQNAQYNEAYPHGQGTSGAHISLLGDPTLRALIVPPVTNLTATSNCTKVNLHWTAPQDPDVLGYHVYRAFEQDGPYLRVSSGLVTGNAWEDLSPVAGTLYYAVRAMKLEITPGGGAFYNTGTSPIQSVVFSPGVGPTAIGLGGTVTCAHPELTLGANFQPPTSTWQWYKPNGQPLNGFIATEPGVYTVVVTAPNGCTVAAYATVNSDTLLPVLDLPSTVTLDCAHPSATLVIPGASPGVTYTFNNAPVAPNQVVTFNSNAQFGVSSSNNGCSDTYLVAVIRDTIPPQGSITSGSLVLDCNHPTVTLTADFSGNNLQYFWSGVNQQPGGSVLTVTAPGGYCCTVTGANGCTADDCATVIVNSTAFGLSIQQQGDSCSAADRVLTVNLQGGTAPFEYNWSNGVTEAQNLVPSTFSGLLTVQVTDGHGCVAAAAILLSTPLKVIALTTKPSHENTSDGAVDLLVTGSREPYTFLWSNGSTAEDLSDLPNGIYTVTVTAANGCSLILAVPLITVGVEEALAEPKFSIAPNPVQDWLTVECSETFGKEYALQLKDAAGRLLKSWTAADKKLSVYTGDLPDGVYFLRVGQNKTFKVVVTHF